LSNAYVPMSVVSDWRCRLDDLTWGSFFVVRYSAVGHFVYRSELICKTVKPLK